MPIHKHVRGSDYEKKVQKLLLTARIKEKLDWRWNDGELGTKNISISSSNATQAYKNQLVRLGNYSLKSLLWIRPIHENSNTNEIKHMIDIVDELDLTATMRNEEWMFCLFVWVIVNFSQVASELVSNFLNGIELETLIIYLSDDYRVITSTVSIRGSCIAEETYVERSYLYFLWSCKYTSNEVI